jgi:hypothetical protein
LVDAPGVTAVDVGATWPVGPAEQAVSPSAATMMTATGVLLTVCSLG